LFLNDVSELIPSRSNTTRYNKKSVYQHPNVIVAPEFIDNQEQISQNLIDFEIFAETRQRSM
jgi:hypothetical protein